MASVVQNGETPVTKATPLVREINLDIVCYLCAGYIVNATTITECLHTFCRSCLLQHFEQEGKMMCPQCGVELNEKQAEALSQVRFDRKFQTVIYQLVPGLRQQELRRREDFVKANSQTSISHIHDADLVCTSITASSSSNQQHALNHSFGYGTNEMFEARSSGTDRSSNNRAFSSRCIHCTPNQKLRDLFIDCQIEPLNTTTDSKPFYVRCRACTSIAQLLEGVRREVLGDQDSSVSPSPDNAAKKSLQLFCEGVPLSANSQTLFDCWSERWFGNKGNMLIKYEVRD